MNFRTSYEWGKYLRVDFAITNLLDKFYYQPLCGVNIAGYEAAGSIGRSFG
jgi:outer membrane receptor protein involved in Fe transport